MRRGRLLLLSLLVLPLGLALGRCASKSGGAAVLVVFDPGEVRGCSFLGRVSQTDTESEPAGQGLLRQRVADMGGNTLLVKPGGTGEAWSCTDRLRAYAPATQPTPTRPVTGLLPTAPATPRY